MIWSARAVSCAGGRCQSAMRARCRPCEQRGEGAPAEADARARQAASAVAAAEGRARVAEAKAVDLARRPPASRAICAARWMNC